ncbi:guanine deaminase [Alteromonas sp. ASW11-130]|uniref:guanine deaminase n=1 Tax=Alteromonas sp. ASW11-130 TaxID=3015775 RepID=UPI002242316F|nr:guanine deaminase [Alteromonas sp. ASW11-130]MCW8093246.1 guanine deaminase [Alteromonas sp. ASW11-130]
MKCRLLFTLLFITLPITAFAETEAFRGSILHFKANPALHENEAESYEYFEDGILVVKDGKVDAVGKASDLLKKYDGVEVKDMSGKLIMPGFVDTHIHYPQTEMIAAFGEQLLDWLKKYTFPTEKQFKDKKYAAEVSEVFLHELLSNGTTSALIFGTVHPESVDVLFEQAQEKNMRIIAGKVMMDRNAPDYLQDTPESSYKETKQLIEKWHNKHRLHYAITPRFAPTSTPAQLEQAKKLKKEYPDTWIHTHLSENKGEIAWVKDLFPERKGYTDVYDHYNLTSSRSIFAHSIHLDDEEMKTLADTKSSIAFCPTSNLFLGSGLFKLKEARDAGVRVGLGTDVGAGTSFSMLETLNEAYKVIQLQSQKLSAFEGYYLATLGGAEALSLDDKIGNFEKNKEADFVVMDWAGTPFQQYRMSKTSSLHEKLFVMMMLGDQRNIHATYVMGEEVYNREMSHPALDLIDDSH